MTYTYSYLHRYRFSRLAHNLFVNFAGFAIILLKNYLMRHINYTWLLHIFFVIGRSLRVNWDVNQEYKEANFQEPSSPLATVVIFIFSFICSNIFYAPKNVHISLWLFFSCFYPQTFNWSIFFSVLNEVYHLRINFQSTQFNDIIFCCVCMCPKFLSIDPAKWSLSFLRTISKQMLLRTFGSLTSKQITHLQQTVWWKK